MAKNVMSIVIHLLKIGHVVGAWQEYKTIAGPELNVMEAVDRHADLLLAEKLEEVRLNFLHAELAEHQARQKVNAC